MHQIVIVMMYEANGDYDDVWRKMLRKGANGACIFQQLHMYNPGIVSFCFYPRFALLSNFYPPHIIFCKTQWILILYEEYRKYQICASIFMYRERSGNRASW